MLPQSIGLCRETWFVECEFDGHFPNGDDAEHGLFAFDQRCDGFGQTRRAVGAPDYHLGVQEDLHVLSGSARFGLRLVVSGGKISLP